MVNLMNRPGTQPGTGAGPRRAGRRFAGWLVGGLTAKFVFLALLLFAVIAGVTGANNEQEQQQQAQQNENNTSLPTGPLNAEKFDSGNIISDAVFFNSDAMAAQQVQQFLSTQGAGCTADTCLANMKVTTPARPADICEASAGGTSTFAVALWNAAQACQINPQVLLATIEKESGGLTKNNPAAGWDNALLGFACPDTGPGGSANCNSKYAGAAAQTWGLAQVFRKYTKNPSNFNYHIGDNKILYNVVEQCQETKAVTIVNQATANMYIYTPYTPSDEALAAYPGAVTGPAAACAAYGNRNFWNLFRKYFGTTGGGAAIPGAPGNPGGPIVVNGPAIRLPAAAGIAGTIQAPNTTTAKAIAAGLSQLGVQYIWGGGDAHGPTTGTLEGCSDSCRATDPLRNKGYDCAGLMLYSWAQVSIDAPRNSQSQAGSGTQVPYDQRIAGDMIGFPGHIAMYIGTFGGTDYMLEAPYSGSQVRVARVRDGHYPNVARIWQGLP